MDWKQLIDRIGESDSLSEQEKIKGREAFRYLKTELFGDEQIDVELRFNHERKSGES